MFDTPKDIKQNSISFVFRIILHTMRICLWRHDNSMYGIVFMSPPANLPRCQMRLLTHYHAFSLYCLSSHMLNHSRTARIKRKSCKVSLACIFCFHSRIILQFCMEDNSMTAVNDTAFKKIVLIAKLSVVKKCFRYVIFWRTLDCLPTLLRTHAGHIWNKCTLITFNILSLG